MKAHRTVQVLAASALVLSMGAHAATGAPNVAFLDSRHKLAQGFDDGGTKGQIGHKMTIHHIDMDPIGTLPFDRFDFAAKIGKISA